MTLLLFFSTIFTILGSLKLVSAWLPDFPKIHGVNLGSQFIIEPWMAVNIWKSLGCDPSWKSEFDCVSHLGQSAANKSWAEHWGSWTTQADIAEMKSFGLNTIRIPVGYWIYEDIVYSNSEYFPQGGLQYLDAILGWARDAGMYVIIDLHAVPGAQVAGNPSTGQMAQSPGFYVTYQYERAYKFLEWMTKIIHTNPLYRSVGMLELVNEPARGDNAYTRSMRSEYYPIAFQRIRAAEASLNVSSNKALHVQMMSKGWGSGDPNEFLTTNDTFRAFDDHHYLKYNNTIGSSPSDYIQVSCSDSAGQKNDEVIIVGEFSLSPNDEVQLKSDFAPTKENTYWYSQWFAAQVQAYEKQAGWIFWSWKAELDDWRWSYRDAVAAGAIPKNLNDVAKASPCDERP